jgi:hypothetical protein
MSIVILADLKMYLAEGMVRFLGFFTCPYGKDNFSALLQGCVRWIDPDVVL